MSHGKNFTCQDSQEILSVEEILVFLLGLILESHKSICLIFHLSFKLILESLSSRQFFADLGVNKLFWRIVSLTQAPGIRCRGAAVDLILTAVERARVDSQQGRRYQHTHHELHATICCCASSYHVERGVNWYEAQQLQS